MNFKILVIFAIFCVLGVLKAQDMSLDMSEDMTLPDFDINDEEIQQYVNTNLCNVKFENRTMLCQSVKDFIFSLRTLEKIQRNNLLLAYKKQSEKKAKKQSSVKYENSKLKALNDSGEQILDYHQIKAKEIVKTTKQEYIDLRNSMVRFCNNFYQLREEEKKMLLSLKWHNQNLFSDEKFIDRFCRMDF